VEHDDEWSTMSACLDETTGARLVAGELSPDEVERAHDHVATCRDCQHFVAELARLEISAPETTRASEPRLDDELRRGETVGRFLVLGRIGAGGMGVVYAAYDPELDRRVALKLLRGGGDGARLLREAQAAARLSHPNVVSVFDIGMYEDRVYLAMEYVEGVTLAEWLRGDRRWEDVVDMFVQAGRGIAAAHEARLIHRDFKPDNVLVGRDGRARVVDFGLARAADSEATPSPASVSDADLDETQPASRGISTPLTRTGALLGTPRYMAPEQFAGGEIVAATDQFAFCVALYAALFRTPPFRGERISEIASVVLAGEITPPAVTSGPTGLRRAIVRGLAVDPARRHPSMAALLRELERARSVRRRRVVAALAAVSIVVVATGAAALTIATRDDTASPSCAAAGEQFARAWDPIRAKRMAAAFRATGALFANDASDRVTTQLDRYGADWTAMYTEACKATHELGKQSAHVLDLRMMCLDRRRASVQALVDVFVEADAGVVQRSIDAVAALDPIVRCGDVEALSQAVPPPADPLTRQRVDAIATSLAEADAQLRAGHYPRGLDLARRTVTAATVVGYAAIEGEAHLKVALLADAAGELKMAEDALDLARRAAALARDDDLAARVWIRMIRVIGYSGGRLRDVEMLIKVADAAVLRAGGASSLQAEYQHILGSLAMTEGDPARARGHFEAALRLRNQTPSTEGPRIATLLNNIGNTHTRQRSYDKARPFVLQALELRTQLLGPHHPEIAESHNNIGALELMSGDLGAAEARMTSALEIWRSALGPEHPDVANALVNLGMILRRRGKVAEAIGHHERALAILRKAVGPRHHKVASTLSHLADDHSAGKDHARAVAAYREAIEIQIETHGAAKIGEIRGRLAESLLALGDRPAAIVELASWLDVTEKRVGRDHADLVWPLAMLGGVALDANDRGRAVTLLERALALAPKSTDVEAVATVKFNLGRALWSGDRRRARLLVDAARSEFATSATGADRVAEVDAWLSRNPP
jgi:tetratricopeptide (TPR) repeat protein/predicted Ser/Thr protein kinase